MTTANEDVGCGGCIAGAIALALVVAAVISIAAIIDPFSWMPTVSEVWADCSDNYDTDADECDLATRFPGFWWHVIANIAYVVVVGVLLIALIGSVAEFRDARAARFDGDEPLRAWRQARRDVTILGLLCLVGGLAPLLLAL